MSGSPIFSNIRGRLPNDALVAIYGNGHTAKGALRILHGLGAEVDVYKWRQMEEFRRNIGRYDVLVNCCMWDTSRSDLARMKRGAMIIDVSCNPELEIETSHPTTIDDPVYTVDHVLHYAVDNTPAMFPISVSKMLAKKVSALVDSVVEGESFRNASTRNRDPKRAYRRSAHHRVSQSARSRL